MAELTELRVLKDEYLSLQKKQAGLESSLESLKSQREALVNECITIGVVPADLQDKINEAKLQYDTAISAIKAKLYKQAPVVDTVKTDVLPNTKPNMFFAGSCPPVTQPDIAFPVEEEAL